MRTAYIAFSTRTVAEFEHYLPEPKAPSNYKDPVKIAEYVGAAKAKQFVDAPSKPLTGVLADVKMLMRTDTSKKVDNVALAWPDEPIATYLLNYDRVSVFNLGEFIRLARIDWIERKGSLTTEMMWLAFSELTNRTLIRPPFIFDPINRLVDSVAEEACDPFLVAKRFLKVDDITFNKKYTGLLGQAQLNVDVCSLLGV